MFGSIEQILCTNKKKIKYNDNLVFLIPNTFKEVKMMINGGNMEKFKAIDYKEKETFVDLVLKGRQIDFTLRLFKNQKEFFIIYKDGTILKCKQRKYNQ